MRFDPRGMTQQERDEMIRQYEESIRPVQSNVEVSRPDPVPAGFGNEGFGNQPQMLEPQTLAEVPNPEPMPNIRDMISDDRGFFPGGNPNFAPSPYAFQGTPMFQRPPMFGGGFGGGFGRPPMGGGKGGYRPPMYGGGFGGPPMFGPPPTQMGPMKGGPRPPMYGGRFNEGFGGPFGGGFGGNFPGEGRRNPYTSLPYTRDNPQNYMSDASGLPPGVQTLTGGQTIGGVFPRPQQPMINRQDSANQLLGSGIAGVGLYNQQTGGSLGPAINNMSMPVMQSGMSAPAVQPPNPNQPDLFAVADAGAPMTNTAQSVGGPTPATARGGGVF